MRRVQEPGGFDVLFYDGVQCRVTRRLLILFYEACSMWETWGLHLPFYKDMSLGAGRGSTPYILDGMGSVPEPEGPYVLFYDSMRSVQEPGRFDVLF